MRLKSIMIAALGTVVLASAYGAASLVRSADALESSAPSSTDAEYSIVVNDSKLSLDSPARLAGSTMLVPARNIAEALGAVVTYEADTQTITAVKDDVTVIFQIGSNTAQRNDTPITLDAAPVLDGNVTMVPVRFFSETFGTVVKWDGPNHRVNIDHESHLLPAVGSYDNLKKLLKDAQDYANIRNEGALSNGSIAKSKSADTAAPAPAAASRQSAAAEASSGSADYSATNVQVQGVDEADVVKTDGEYIYQVNRDRVIIARAYPDGDLSLVSAISLKDQKLQPHELYVDGDRLIVIGSSYPDDNKDGAGSMAPANPEMKKMFLPPVRNNTVKTVIYDITSRENPKAVKEVETEGAYVTSRKIGSDLYVIANQYVNYYRILNEAADLPAPSYRDTSVSNEFISTGYDKIRYFPDSAPESYMLIAGIDTAKPERKADVSVYLGSAQNVYASSKNLYISMSQHQWGPVLFRSSGGAGGPISDMAVANPEPSSIVYKFLMEQGKVRFTAKGQVPGTVLNQFSMDEHNGYFRIATTKGDVWGTGEFASKNNLYVLDESLNITGQIEDIAPGERIYSVRFMGGRGYMVTFKKVDPLFVLDLADPFHPSILGKLKIPGYSDYLHPYDETHLIGFGKDAVEQVNEWELQQGVAAPSTTAYYQGMKLAMFDVSDVEQPKELFKAAIGDRGTDSELLRNHKALLFSKEKNLLAFPVTVMEVDPEVRQEQGAMAYGQFTFQGAYVYRVDLQEGFKLRGAITHLSEEDLQKSGSGWYNGTSNVERILYIGNSLYTLSQSQIRANDLDTLQEQKRLMLP